MNQRDLDRVAIDAIHFVDGFEDGALTGPPAEFIDSMRAATEYFFPISPVPSSAWTAGARACAARLHADHELPPGANN